MLLHLAFAALTLTCALHAQETARRLPVDDPRLFQQFLSFHDGVASAIQTRYGQNAQAAAKEEKSFADKLRVRQNELPIVTAVARGLVADVNKWQADLKSYVERARGQKQQPDPAVLLQFSQQRRQLIDAAVMRLSATLTPAGWAGLRSYVNGEYRSRLRMVEGKQAKR